ncbi:MAG: DNA polymerase ligase N-terminal domain-containing protein [Planctomycetaceae bacterium]
MPRYAILQHDHPQLHWDFLLENGEIACCWRLAERPEVGVGITAERIADHRLVYLDYEGPVSGDRGVVAQWDAGEYRVAGAVAWETSADIVLRGRRSVSRAILSGGPDKCVWTFV